MLIVVENESFPTDRRVYQEAMALREDGYDVTVVSPAGDRFDRGFRDEVAGIRIRRFRRPRDTGRPLDFATGYVLAWVRVASIVLQVQREHPIDVLQACNPPDTYFLLALLLRPFGVRFIFDQHDLCPEVYTSRFPSPRPEILRALTLLERLSHRVADEVVTVNESCRDLLLSRTGVPGERIVVVRNAPDLARLTRGPAVPELRRGASWLLCWVGVMGPQDNVDLVVRATAELVLRRGRDVHVALVGFGEGLEPARALAAELGVTEHVTFTGRVDSAAVSSFLSSADLGLQADPRTDFNECCSMLKTIEYAAFGLPVVAFDLRETRRTAGEAAVYVQEETPEAFADAIETLLDDDAERKRRSDVALERAHGPLAWEAQRRVYLEVVDRVCRRARTRARRRGPRARREGVA